jgi:hypothetical protein
MYTLRERLAAAAKSVVVRKIDSGFMIASTHTLRNMAVLVVSLLSLLNG